jgi:D-ribose pyranase
MKRLGHLNRDIARVLAGMGFFDVLDSVLADFKVERAVFASESLTHNAAVVARMAQLRDAQVAVDEVPHETFKRLCQQAKAVIRTGECSPYANVILHSGVIF